MQPRTRSRLIVSVIAAIVSLVAYFAKPAPAELPREPQQTPTTPVAEHRREPPRPAPSAEPTRDTDEPGIRTAQLPAEARETLRLIASDGPFPFDRDGIEFRNQEGLLPKRGRGYYREYTVVTPGERTRGARRIVTGERGEQYYSDDHYQSFSKILP